MKPFSRSGMSAAVLIVLPAFASAQDPTSDSFRELESKYIFGFTFGRTVSSEARIELKLLQIMVFVELIKLCATKWLFAFEAAA